jgi:hypothetical protein
VAAHLRDRENVDGLLDLFRGFGLSFPDAVGKIVVVMHSL